MSPGLKLLLELGPLLAFFAAFKWFADLGDLEALLWATGAFMVALTISMTITYAATRELSKLSLVTLAIVIVMGALTLWLQNETFVKMKPTLVYLFMAGALGVGLLRGESYLQHLMGAMLPLSDAGWMALTRNWALFAFAMAVLNEVVWRTQSADVWVDVKTFAYLPITFIFMLTQGPLIAKHQLPDPEEQAANEYQSEAKTSSENAPV